MGKMVNTYKELKNKIDAITPYNNVIKAIKTDLNLYGIIYLNKEVTVWTLFNEIWPDASLAQYEEFLSKTAHLNYAYIYMKLALAYLDHIIVW